MKKVFTTGQIAKICKVAPRTVSKWCDTGRLNHYRIPGSMDRRVPREELLKFLKAHGMPTAGLDASGLRRVLCVGLPPDLGAAVANALDGDQLEGVSVSSCSGLFTAGCEYERVAPEVVVVSLWLGRPEAEAVAARCAVDGFTALAVAGEDLGQLAEQQLKDVGFARVFRSPFDPAELTAVVRGLLEDR